MYIRRMNERRRSDYQGEQVKYQSEVGNVQ